MHDVNAQVDLVRVPAGTFVAVQRVLASELDPQDAADRVRRIGMETGRALYQLFRDRVAAPGGSTGSVEDLESAAFWSRLEAFFHDLGWGGLEHERLHPGVISLWSTDWFESAAAGDLSQPSCQFTVGALGELFQEVTTLEVAVMEVRCRAAGAQECRFLIGSPEALGSVFERMSGGSHYREAVAGLPS
ncbi:MAG TPA: V4R domain-containing protein [Longimicrobiaceae bacterium]|nr:V4R domain-containing protein [Longimicrobiaceae bacterium]